MSERFPRVSSLKNAAGLRARLETLGCPLPCDEAALAAPESPLAAPLRLAAGGGAPVDLANRFVVQPMEGWDGSEDGTPSDLTRRRWRRFGSSGAAWVWGGEAVAVRTDGRANPNQLLIDEGRAAALGSLRRELAAAAREAGHAEPFVGLQLTHSGRWSRPTRAGAAPRLGYRHPLLDRRVGVERDAALLSDADLEALTHAFAGAAALAWREGFAFVDLKHCHGYLLHELLSARTRPGRYGGDALEARTRFLFETLHAMREAAPELPIGMRLSVFDGVPHRASGAAARGLGPGEPEPHPLPYSYAFGANPRDPARLDLAEPVALARALVERGVRWLNVSAGSPYYIPHVQRPAAFPPSDGYAPPEDPLAGVARLLTAARELKRAVPEATVVSSGWTYLQEFVPHVAQACVREGWFDAVGLGRMALSYPDLPADVLAGRPLARRKLCRTFSDCTTAPRNGLVSGCYPLDPFYKERPERDALARAKREGPRG